MDVAIAREARKVGEVPDYGLCEGAFSGAGDAAGHHYNWTGVRFCAAQMWLDLGCVSGECMVAVWKTDVIQFQKRVILLALLAPWSFGLPWRVVSPQFNQVKNVEAGLFYVASKRWCKSQVGVAEIVTAVSHLIAETHYTSSPH